MYDLEIPASVFRQELAINRGFIDQRWARWMLTKDCAELFPVQRIATDIPAMTVRMIHENMDRRGNVEVARRCISNRTLPAQDTHVFPSLVFVQIPDFNIEDLATSARITAYQNVFKQFKKPALNKTSEVVMQLLTVHRFAPSVCSFCFFANDFTFCLHSSEPK